MADTAPVTDLVVQADLVVAFDYGQFWLIAADDYDFDLSRARAAGYDR